MRWTGIGAIFVSALLVSCSAQGPDKVGNLVQGLTPQDAFEALTLGPHAYRELGSELTQAVGQQHLSTCSIGAESQPDVYEGNSKFDCLHDFPNNEVFIASDPSDPDHAISAYHSYELVFTGQHTHVHVVLAASVTFDGGKTWTETKPPLYPYQFSGDPVVWINSKGEAFFAGIADHEGSGGAFTAPSVIVSKSTDGGLTWGNLVTVNPGSGAINGAPNERNVFQDKNWIAGDANAGSPYQDRVYVTNTAFDFKITGYSPVLELRLGFMLTYSDDGVTWSTPSDISGFSAHCPATIVGRHNECDLNQGSTIASSPDGTVAVGGENFNTVAENQFLVRFSSNGGRSFGNPVKAGDIYDINLPSNRDGRDTLTGCAFRWGALGNIAADPTDASGSTFAAVWSDNRNGTSGDTNVDLVVAITRNRGQTWEKHVIERPNDQFYPYAAFGPTGDLVVGYDDRNGHGRDECVYDFRLTTLAFNKKGRIVKEDTVTATSKPSYASRSRWFADATGNTSFIGDYNAIAVDSLNRVWFSHTDLREPNLYRLDPYRIYGQHGAGGLVE